MTEQLAQSQADPDPSEEDFWDELILNIEQHRVVPIVGRGLLQVEVNGQPELVDRYLARELRSRFARALADLAAPSALPPTPSLSDVVGQLLAGRIRSISIYSAVHKILSKVELSPPRALMQLAEITHFNLFVTTDIDSLLEKAIDAVSFGGTNGTESIAYCPTKVADLSHDYPGERKKQDWPTVYHLLGRCCEWPEYVISEEDLLEFVCALQAERYERQPKKLFDALRNSYLLILGSDFPDWLTRFFLRTARQNRLSRQRLWEKGELLEILADSGPSGDRNLVWFLRNFSTSTRVVCRQGGTAEFIGELRRRWGERNPKAPLRRWPPPPDHMKEGAVFISYASEDRAAVQTLKNALESEGLDVWFDQAELEAGDDWDYKIRTNIRKASCFVPVLSQHINAPGSRYFRKEWTWALDHASGFAPDKKFLFPVVLDDTSDFGAALSGKFQELPAKQMTHLPGGQATPEFLQLLRKAVTENLARNK